MSTNIMDTFIDWLDEQEKRRDWTDYRLAMEAKINPSVLSRARSGTLPKWEACMAIAKAFKIPPALVFRKAGLLPSDVEGNEQIAEILHIVDTLPPEEQADVLEYALLRLRIAEEKAKKETDANRARRHTPSAKGA